MDWLNQNGRPAVTIKRVTAILLVTGLCVDYIGTKWLSLGSPPIQVAPGLLAERRTAVKEESDGQSWAARQGTTEAVMGNYTGTYSSGSSRSDNSKNSGSRSTNSNNSSGSSNSRSKNSKNSGGSSINSNNNSVNSSTNSDSSSSNSKNSSSNSNSNSRSDISKNSSCSNSNSNIINTKNNNNSSNINKNNINISDNDTTNITDIDKNSNIRNPRSLPGLDSILEEVNRRVTSAERPVVNPHDFRYMLNEPEACRGGDVEMVIAVTSRISSLAQRQGIRDTWGKIAKDATKKTVVLFFFGKMYLPEQPVQNTSRIQRPPKEGAEMTVQMSLKNFSDILARAPLGEDFTAVLGEFRNILLGAFNKFMEELQNVLVQEFNLHAQDLQDSSLKEFRELSEEAMENVKEGFKKRMKELSEDFSKKFRTRVGEFKERVVGELKNRLGDFQKRVLKQSKLGMEDVRDESINLSKVQVKELQNAARDKFKMVVEQILMFYKNASEKKVKEFQDSSVTESMERRDVFEILKNQFHTQVEKFQQKLIEDAKEEAEAFQDRLQNDFNIQLEEFHYRLLKEFKVKVEQQHLLLLSESKTYGDIVQEDFIDSYRNLSLKSVAILRWVSQFCSKSTFVLKVDDDMYINIPLLLTKVRVQLERTPMFIMGQILSNNPPFRQKNHKWFVPYSQYKQGEYPNYVSGTAYSMSTTAAMRLYVESFYVRPIYMEDIYVTGILADSAMIPRVKDHQFSGHNKVKPSGCEFRKIISGHENSPQEMRKIHRELNDLELKC
ncbi:hypothetical protein EGW08_020904 [Elysia chlorotica]|uniref:Hexosyltransferase n=1 Tax=Elysia chlorotica TaxID=188477 RepID=A0A3S1BNU1_ELYCH|nr:hypothetical protein EGW08_020904 [Elysia chlorotica]